MFSATACLPQDTVEHAHVRKLPKLLKHLYDPKCEDVEVAEMCERIFDKEIVVTKEEAAYLEESTRHQAESLVWFEHRAGRITASKFSAASKAKLHPPPACLVDEIVTGGNTARLSNVPAIQWDIKNEPIAREAYLIEAQQCHVNLSYRPTGLYINPEYPHLGASPDGLISCECCGEGLIEIKCPYSIRDQNPADILTPYKEFCLQPNESGKLMLSTSHGYYVQVQGQLAICDKDYCDFICWTPHGLYVERINREESVFGAIKPALDLFFKEAILPRLVRYGTKPISDTPKNDCKVSTAAVYCFCKKAEFGRMIACDNENCTIVWFHFTCVGLSRAPKGKWFCSDNCKETST